MKRGYLTDRDVITIEPYVLPDIRLYEVGPPEDVWFAVTRGRLLVCATHDYARAVQHYARERRIDPLFVVGPTHSIRDVRELNQGLATAWE